MPGGGIEKGEAEAQEALQRANGANELAGQALSLAQTNETRIETLDGQVAEIETKTINIPKTPPSDNSLLAFDAGGDITHYIYYGKQYSYNAIPQYDEFGYLHSNINNTLNDDYAVLALKDIKKLLSLQEFKTIFGNKSIKGSGNIDLYKHSIKITANISGYGATYAEIYFDEFSSKNTVVDSIPDLKTLLGNTFEKPVSGIAASDTADLQIMYITQDGMYGYGKSWTFASATNIEITDTVATI